MSSKIKIFIACFAILGAFHAQSQEFKGGITAGLNASQVAGDGLGGFNKLGINVGGLVSMEVNESVSISLEIIYNQKGSQKKPNVEQGDRETFKLKLDYIDIPLTVNYRVNDLIIDLGGYVGVLVNSKQIHNGFERENNPPYNTTEIGGLVGAKYLIREKFFGGVRFAHSIIPIRPTPDPSQVWTFYDKGQYSQLLQFSLGWYLN